MGIPSVRVAMSPYRDNSGNLFSKESPKGLFFLLKLFIMYIYRYFYFSTFASGCDSTAIF
jgi:hypothetical protein